MFKREHFRGVGVFFGIGEERPYYVEKTPSLLIERLRHNVMFFYLNYMAIAGVMFFLMMLMSPSTIIGLVLLGALWMWFVRASQDGTLRIGTGMFASINWVVGSPEIRTCESYSSVRLVAHNPSFSTCGSTEDGDDRNRSSVSLVPYVATKKYLLVGDRKCWVLGRCACPYAGCIHAQGSR